jgi:hypothetical protein
VDRRRSHLADYRTLRHNDRISHTWLFPSTEGDRAFLPGLKSGASCADFL